MPDKPQEKAIGEGFLRWYNASHATGFRITGWPDESCSIWDLDAVCVSSGRKMAIEVGEAQVANFCQHLSRRNKWEEWFGEVANAPRGLPDGQWAITFSQWPELRRGPRRRLIDALLRYIADHPSVAPKWCGSVGLDDVTPGVPGLAGITVDVDRITGEGELAVLVDIRTFRSFDPTRELLKAKSGDILEEAKRKFASAAPGVFRALVLWYRTFPSTRLPWVSGARDFVARHAGRHNLDGVYVVKGEGVPRPAQVADTLLALFEKED